MKMILQILFCFFAAASAAPQFPGYNLPSPIDNGRTADNGNSNIGNQGPIGSHGCITGLCEGAADVSRKIYIFEAPQVSDNRQIDQPSTPKPKLNYNIVFVRTPEGSQGPEPIVIPPAQEKTLVYVLTKDEEITGPQVIEMPDGLAHPPEVFYINYKEGDNPQLPIGVDLQTALASAISEQGQLVQGGGSIGSGNDSGSPSSDGGIINGRNDQVLPPNPQPPSNSYGAPPVG